MLRQLSFRIFFPHSIYIKDNNIEPLKYPKNILQIKYKTIVYFNYHIINAQIPLNYFFAIVFLVFIFLGSYFTLK